MYEPFLFLKPLFENLLPYVDMLADPEFFIRILWMIAWVVALVIGMQHLKTVREDWKAVVAMNIRNGRRLIARNQLRTMHLLVWISVLNLIPGLIAVFLVPSDFIYPDLSRLITVICLLLAAFLTTLITIFKRRDRAKWEEGFKRDR